MSDQLAVLDIEAVVLGSLILEGREIMDIVSKLIRVDSFYDERNQVIYQAIESLYQENKGFDLVLLYQFLRQHSHQKIEASYISQLTNSVCSTSSVEYYALILEQYAIRRRLIKLFDEKKAEALEQDTDVFDLLDTSKTGIEELTAHITPDRKNTITDGLTEAFAEIERSAQGFSGVPSGFHELDKKTFGWQNSELIILAARPGMGKTAFMLNSARHAAKEKYPVLFFSYEMSKSKLSKRLISAETGIHFSKLNSGNVADWEWQEINNKLSRLSAAPFFMEDNPSLSIYQLCAYSRQMQAKHGIKMIIIDYLQLIPLPYVKGRNREQEVSIISRTLKKLSMELDIPVIALSQLSREVEKRGGDKVPNLSDLRDSGAIEQDADSVIFLYRPEYYGLTEDIDNCPTEGVCKVIISKGRNTGRDELKIGFDGSIQRFYNLDDNYNSPSNFNRYPKADF